MKHRLFALGFFAPLSLLACVTSNNATPTAGDDAGACISANGVILCGPIDAAASGCTVNAAGALVCDDATIPDASVPDAPIDAADSASAIDSAFPAIDAGPPPPATGTLVWADDIQGNDGFFGHTVIDPAGNRYFAGTVAGTFEVAPGFSATNAFYGKVDATGAFQAVTNTGGTYGYAVARDPLTGTLYLALGFTDPVTVAGTLYTSKGGLDFLITKLDANGNVVSAAQFGGAGFDQPWQMAFGGGRLVIAGYTNGPIDFGGGKLTPAGSDGAFVLGLDSSLTYVYAHVYSGATDASSVGGQGLTVDVDSNGDAFTGGTFSGQVDFGGGGVSAVGSDDSFLVSLDPSGAYRWSQLLGATGSAVCEGIAVAADGTVYAVGQLIGSGNFGNGVVAAPGSVGGYLASWTNAGAYRWATTFGSTSGVGPAAVAVDRWDEAVFTGNFEGKLTLGATPYTANSEENGFLAKVDPNGNFLWSQQWTGGIDVQPQDISVDDLGQVTVSGSYFGGNMTLNGTTSLPGGATTDYGFLLMTKP